MQQLNQIRLPAQEPTLQAILTYRNRIASNEKIIQALNIALKLEKQQFDQELTEFSKQLDERQKPLKDYFDILKQEIEKLQTCLNNEEV